MPLAFHSENHGTIAFGFFNIETDLLLLEHYFFFASDFCEAIRWAAAATQGPVYERPWEGYEIPPEQIGDLHGAIAGVRFSGFIGEVYRKFPFPKLPEGFKQNPDGFKTRPVMEKLIARFAEECEITFRIDETGKSIDIGEYRFSYPGFHALIQYVWRGGYPRWREEERPSYVLSMKDAIEKSQRPVFHGLRLV